MGTVNVRDAYGVPGHDVRAGDRAPDAPELVSSTGETTRLFDIFSPAAHTVLLFSSGDLIAVQNMLGVLGTLPTHLFNVAVVDSPGRGAQSPAPGVDFVLEDAKGHAKEGYGLKNTTSPVAVLVRPDGMIGAFATSPQGVEKYLSVVFSRVV